MASEVKKRLREASYDIRNVTQGLSTMYSDQLETLAIYWTSAVSLPYFNPTIVVLALGKC